LQGFGFGGFFNIKGSGEYAGSERRSCDPQLVTVSAASMFLNSAAKLSPATGDFTDPGGPEHGWGWKSWWKILGQWKDFFPSCSTRFLCYH